jgi:Polyketide cyclase / dehydrase and lipid transport
MVRAEKVTEGPVGKGTRFSWAIMSRGRPADTMIEFTGYDRPVRLAQVATMRQADMSGTLTFEPVGNGTRMRWSWQVRPKGAFKLLAPVTA